MGAEDDAGGEQGAAVMPAGLSGAPCGAPLLPSKAAAAAAVAYDEDAAAASCGGADQEGDFLIAAGSCSAEVLQFADASPRSASPCSGSDGALLREFDATMVRLAASRFASDWRQRHACVRQGRYAAPRGGPMQAHANTPCMHATSLPSWQQIAEGLSQLGPTPAGGRPAYLSLSISGTTLASAGPLAACEHLQAARLPCNRLACITALGALRGLSDLDVSGNQLTQLLDLGGCASSSSGGGSGSGGGRPPAAAGSLQEADFSFNRIARLRDVSAFTRLRRLGLDGNALERVGRGLAGLAALRVLSLRDNLLESAEGLQGAARNPVTHHDANRRCATAN